MKTMNAVVDPPTLPVVLWILARPRLLPFVLCLPLVGFGWAHWDHALHLRGLADLIWVLAAWTFLHAGSLWLNAELDRDQGEVLMGHSIPVPSIVAPCGYASLIGGVCLAFAGSLLAGFAAVTCASLAVFYSHPATVGKGHPFCGPMVNGTGYGLLSTFAGWTVVNVTPDLRTITVWFLGMFGVLGCYFSAQAFQGDEDKARGYRTLVVTHGPRGCLNTARICIGSGFLGGTALAGIGWLPRVCLIALPLGVWVDFWLRAWAKQPGGGDERWARVLAIRLLVSAVVVICLAYGDYLLAWKADEPVAGMGTVCGHP